MRVLAAMAAVTSVARAEVDGEVSVGGGDETGAGGYAVARAGLSARLVRAAAPLLERGAHHCPPEEKGCIWVFTGLDPDQINGIGAALEASIHASREGDLEDGLAFGGKAWATGAGWRLGVRA